MNEKISLCQTCGGAIEYNQLYGWTHATGIRGHKGFPGIITTPAAEEARPEWKPPVFDDGQIETTTPKDATQEELEELCNWHDEDCSCDYCAEWRGRQKCRKGETTNEATI